MHLLYARFWHKVLFDAGLVSTKEPFQRLFHQGMIHKLSYRDLATGKYYHPEDVEKRGDKFFALGTDMKSTLVDVIGRLNVPAGKVVAEYTRNGEYVDEVRITNVPADAHSRLPGYFRGRVGTVERVFEGDYAYFVHTGDGIGDPMPIYMVEFDPTEDVRDLRAGMSVTVNVDTRTLPPWNPEQTASAQQ